MAPSPLFSPRSFEPGVSLAPIRLEKETLDKKGLSLLQKDAEFVVAAPVMPIKMVAPVEIPKAKPAAGNITWE